MNKRRSVLFKDLPEAKAKLLAWLVVGVSLYLLPLIFITLKDYRDSSGSVGPWLPQGTEERQVFDKFADLFQNHDSLHLSWDGGDPEDERFETLTEEIIKADRIRAWQTGEEPLIGSIVTLRTFIDSFGERAKDPEFRQKVTDSMAGYLTSEGQTTGILTIESTDHGANNREKTFELVDRKAREILPAGVEPRYAGPCFLSICANQETRKVLRFVTPISSLISLLVAWFFLRSPILALIAFCISGLAAALSISAIHFGGHTLGNMLSMVPSLAQLLAMSNVIHLINYYMESLHKHNDKERAWRDAISNGWMPTVAASMTTVIGFSSLLATNIEVVKHFALYGTIAVIIAMVVVLTSTTASLILLKPDANLRFKLRERFVGWLFHLASERKWAVTASLLSIFLLGGLGLDKLKSDVRMGSFFPEESRYRSNKSWFEAKMGPIMGSELLVSFAGTVDLEKQIQTIAKLGSQVRDLDTDYMVFAPSIFAAWLETEPANKVWDKITKSGMGVMEDGRYLWRVSIRHPLEPDPGESVFQSQIKRLIERAESNPAMAKNDRPDISLTGAFQLFANSQDGLVNQLLRSFLCAFLLITPVIMIFLRSISLGLIAMVGNLFPLVVFFGILGWTGFRIDIATMMTAAVAFGIAVDDTVHFLTWLSRGLRRHNYLTNAVKYAFENCAVAILQTTLIISAGMGAFLLSDFQPSLRFALFSGVVLMIAVVGDLVLLPACILGIFKKVFQKKPGQPNSHALDAEPHYEKKLESV